MAWGARWVCSPRSSAASWHCVMVRVTVPCSRWAMRCGSGDDFRADLVLSLLLPCNALHLQLFHQAARDVSKS